MGKGGVLLAEGGLYLCVLPGKVVLSVSLTTLIFSVLIIDPFKNQWKVRHFISMKMHVFP